MLKYRKILGFAAATLLATTVVGSAFPVDAAQLRAPAVDFGRVNPARTTSLTVHLKLPNEALFKRTVDALYDPQSPTFHQWLTDAQLRRFAPPAAELAAVCTELERNGLSITSVSNDGFSIQARGTIASIERAFHTEIHQFSRNGKAFQANTRPPTLSGAAGSYLSLVSGLERHTVEPTLVRAINPATKKPFPAVPLAKLQSSGGLSSVITDQIVGQRQTFAYTTNGGLPTATYTGIVYEPNPSLDPDFTPKQLEQIYGLDAAYAKGLDGTGQTIVLLEAFGYPTALADANTFASLTGLPPLNSRNFSIVYPEGQPNPQAGILTGWDAEIALDIQWAHSIAPGAKILVVASNGDDNEDFQESMRYIIDHHLGYAVSDSWYADIDLLAGPAEQDSYEKVLMAAAAKGISFQFATGDNGDFGLGSPLGAASVPAGDPYVTAVGGTAIFNEPGKSAFVSLGWGNDPTILYEGGPIDPPTEGAFFSGGGGGGESVFWPKPAWQRALPGLGRQTPDISALADPYTGVPIVLTLGSPPCLPIALGAQQCLLGRVGGTSLASPIFTAFWAIADQRAGHPLGLAAPTIAGLRSGVTDVVPVSNIFSGTVTDSKGTTTYTASEIFASAGFSQKKFLAALWNIPGDVPADDFTVGLGFAADSSLTVGPGWDNATGFGTPSGLDFINAAAAYH